MRSFAVLFAPALLFANFVAAPPAWAASETVSCQTVNGRTVCVRSQGSVSCQTVNGSTICTESSSMSCQSINGVLTCQSGSVVQSLETEVPDGPSAELEADTSEAAPEPRRPAPNVSIEQQGARQKLSITRGGANGLPALSIEQDGSKLRIRNGAIDLRVGQ